MSGTLTIKPLKGNLLHDTATGKMDPYCVVIVGNQQFKTKVHHDGGKKPCWNDSFNTRVEQSVDLIKFIVWDKDTFTSDNCVGEGVITADKIKSVAQSGQLHDVTLSYKQRQNVGTVTIETIWYPDGGQQQQFQQQNMGYQYPQMQQGFQQQQPYQQQQQYQQQPYQQQQNFQQQQFPNQQGFQGQPNQQQGFNQQQQYGQQGYNQQQGGFNQQQGFNPNQQQGFNPNQQQGFNQNQQQGYNQQQGGGYNQQQGYNQQGGLNQQYNQQQQGGFNQQQGGFNQGFNQNQQGGFNQGFNQNQQQGFNQQQGGFNQGQFGGGGMVNLGQYNYGQHKWHFNRKIEKKELKKLIKKLFDKYDQDGSDTLDERELQGALSELFVLLNHPPPHPDIVWVLMEEYDYKGKGKLKKKQFKTLAQDLCGLMKHDKMKKLKHKNLF